MASLNFKKGTFITNKYAPNIFAIFGGKMYIPDVEGEPYDRSLLCYYDPCFIDVDDLGNETSISVFDCEIDGNECQWTISDGDKDWRECTQQEINAAIKLLFDVKKLAWDDTTKSLRHLRPNETLKINSETKPTTTTPSKANTITLTVKTDWVQKNAIRTINAECADFIKEKCEKLKSSFSTYGGYYQGGFTEYCRELQRDYDDLSRDAWGNYYEEY